MRTSNPSRYFLVFSISILLFPVGLWAQDEENEEKDLSLAVSEMYLSNFLVWGYDRWVLQAGYAEISPESWRDNLKNGFQWDKSTFFTNQVLHPYQGSLYFNSARTNGYSFWESVPFAVSGSFMWELFCEKEQPSYNDLITTSFGGVALGEGGYRLASLLLYDDTPGYKGVLKKVFATIFNPVLTVNKLIYGEEAKPPRKLLRAHYELSIISGMTRTKDEYWLLGASPYPFFGTKLKYGDPYDEREEYAPYDYFTFQAFVDVNASNPTWDIFGFAMLYGRKLYIGDEDRGVIGFYQHFDYLENFVYKFAANGAGVGVQLHYPFLEKRTVEFMLHLYGIALGGVDSRYSQESSGREYSLGPGAGLKTGFFLEDGEVGNLSVLYSRYWFYTASGSDSQNIVGIFSAVAEHFIKNDLRLGVEFLIYDRWSNAIVDNSSTYGFRTYLVYDLDR